MVLLEQVLKTFNQLQVHFIMMKFPKQNTKYHLVNVQRIFQRREKNVLTIAQFKNFMNNKPTLLQLISLQKNLTLPPNNQKQQIENLQSLFNKIMFTMQEIMFKQHKHKLIKGFYLNNGNFISIQQIIVFKFLFLIFNSYKKIYQQYFHLALIHLILKVLEINQINHNIQQKQVITYSKISEILANAGSIASTILLFSYLILTLNQSQMQFQAINKVVSMYYPDFKDIKIKRNLLGRIVQASINGRLLDLPSFKKYYEKLSKIGEFKLTISNQIYEISRIQMLLQQIISKEQILQTHKKGLPMQIFYIDAQNEENQNIDQSIVYETRLKKSCVVPINDKGQMIIQMIESKSNHISMGLQTTDHTFTDADFSLLVMPNEHTQDKQQLQNIQEFVIQQD